MFFDRNSEFRPPNPMKPYRSLGKCLTTLAGVLSEVSQQLSAILEKHHPDQPTERRRDKWPQLQHEMTPVLATLPNAT